MKRLKGLYDPMNILGAPLTLAPPIATFLARHGQSGAELELLPGDASARSYIRLVNVGNLLMEDRTDPAGFAAFIRLGASPKQPWSERTSGNWSGACGRFGLDRGLWYRNIRHSVK